MKSNKIKEEVARDWQDGYGAGTREAFMRSIEFAQELHAIAQDPRSKKALEVLCEKIQTEHDGRYPAYAKETST